MISPKKRVDIYYDSNACLFRFTQLNEFYKSIYVLIYFMDLDLRN